MPELQQYFKQKVILKRYDNGNLKEHRQMIEVKFLDPTDQYPPRVSIQIRTTEIQHPISYRFSSPADLLDFILAVVDAYKLLIFNKIEDQDVRFALLDMFKEKILGRLRA